MSHKTGQRNGCACIRCNNGTQSLEMAGIHFLHSSSPPCVYTHMAFIIVFPLPNDPNPKKQGRPVLEIFRGRQICLAYFQCLGMDQEAVVWKCTVLMCWRAALATFTVPPPRRKDKPSSFTVESDKGSTLDASGESTFTTCNCPAAVKRCSTLRLCACPFELTEDRYQWGSVFSSTSGDTNSKTSKKECEDVLKT